MFIGQHSGSGTPSIDDILNYTQCKLLMPFTVNLNDHSAYAHQVNNTEVILGENGAVFNGSSAYLKVPKLINEWSSDWTCEFIVSSPDTASTVSQLILDSRASGKGFIIRIVRGNVEICTTDQITAYSAKAPLANNETAHFTITKDGNTFSIYKNGKFINSITESRTLQLLSSWNIGKDNYITSDLLNGTLGGFKFVNRVLKSSEFSLTRPFMMNKVNFTSGNRTFIYNDGLWNSEYVKQQAGTVIFNESDIKMGGSSKLIVENLPKYCKCFVEVLCTQRSNNVDDVNYGIHIMIFKKPVLNGGEPVSRITPIYYQDNHINKKFIFGMDMIEPHLYITIGPSQIAYITKIWYE